ncbi:MAG: hypothetical protein IIV47_02670 [Clostridia bacterium]|nr:hypothetical protein [Clostridia bacterium]
MRKITDEYFEEYLIPLMRKYREVIFEDLEKNLCLEHYNVIHKTNFTEKDIELNPTKCWVCKHIKDRH